MNTQVHFVAKTRDNFLSARRSEIDTVKREYADYPEAIIVDPGDEIICDSCNAMIETDLIWVSMFGAYCGECRRKV